MKKDKNWLKEEINKVTSRIYGADFNTIKETDDLIDQLEEPEINEEQALNKLAESYPFSAQGINAILQAQIAGYSPVSTVKFVQPSEPELPVIPQFVADWIEESKRVDDDFWEAATEMIRDSITFLTKKGREVHDWLFGNSVIVTVMLERQKLITRAWLDGYTIEKETMYRVKLPDVESESYNNLLGLRRTVDDRIVICKIKLSTFLHSDNVCFTEKEIKRNHEYLWQFAEEVSE